MLYDLAMEEGWTWCSWARENDPIAAFAGIERSSPGYVGQETEKLKKQAFDAYKLE